ncbi:MAG: sigma-54-dependent Fis family transcriptional regulator, partial [Chloroflexi bacterium]|nr:sigma-54-dependent Fis family transcriptional regulator [Chloroflexota bacterium]
MRGVILIVDDEETLSFFLKQSLEEEGYEVLLARTGQEGLDALGQNQVDLALLDLMLPDMEGSQVLRELRGMDADLPVIILTGHGTINSAVEAMRLGAYDYVEKPLDLTALKLSIARALESLALRREIERLRAQSRLQSGWIVGGSRKMREISSLVERVAKSKAPVLIQGESGTGKEVIAQSIHRESERNALPFLALNCAAIPENLLETELFGHEAGAFTDAKRQKKGLIEMADGGTLFLDEIGAMRPDMQAKLLRVLESETLRRVGATKDMKVDLRVIAATNRDLDCEVEQDRFRADLFYRLNVISVSLPPLRDRLEDIPELVEYFCERLHREKELPRKRFHPDALKQLQQIRWVGNVRELENVVERLVLLSP